jgi:inositol transport system permease protein
MKRMNREIGIEGKNAMVEQTSTKKKFYFGTFYARYGVFLILAVAFLLSSALAPGMFCTGKNLRNVLLAVVCTTVLAFGATFVIILGHINIAYGSELAFIGVASVIANVRTGSLLLALVTAFSMGFALGALTGFLVTRLYCPSFIVTLALTEACRGAAIMLAGETTVQVTDTRFALLGQGYVGPIPMSILIMVMCFAAASFVLNQTVFGRQVYAVGGNTSAAIASGIKPKRVVMKAFILDGIFAGVASLLLMARLNAGVPSAGNGYEMDAITAVVIGGTSMSGGSGTLIGTIAGAVIVGILNNIQTLLGIDGNVQKIVKGVVIVTVVVIDIATKTSVKKTRRKENSD